MYFFDTDTNTLSFEGATGTSEGLKDGDVVGPSSSLDLELCRFNGTTGTNIQGVGIRHYGPLAADPVTPTPKPEINTIIQ